MPEIISDDIGSFPLPAGADREKLRETASKIAAGASVYRDDPPELEYFAARNQMVSPDAVVEIIKTYMEPAGDTLEGRLSGESISKIQSLRLLNLKDIVADSLYRDYLEAGDAGLLRQAAGLNPYNVKFKNQLGIEVGKRGDLVEAVKYFTEAIKISPDFADAHCNLGYAYQLQGRRDDAVKHYRAALEINPRLSKARELLNAAVRQ